VNGNNANLIRAVRGPIMMITVGVLFALNQMTSYGFGQTWPALLIVGGLLSLAARSREPKQDGPTDTGGGR
jgi:hypothetical protein